MTEPVVPIKYTDEVPADLVGMWGKAWIVDLEESRKNHPEIPDDTTIAAWIVIAPAYHPHISSYMIAVIHLRPDAEILLKNASHEIYVIALNPDYKVPLNARPYMLEPLNFIGQFWCKDDQEAMLRAQKSIWEILRGTLSPDSDFINEWAKRYSDSNIRKAPSC